MEEYQHYVLFPNHDNGMRLHKELRALKVYGQICPTPRAASKCCGISLMVHEEDLDVIRKCVKEYHIDILEIVKLKKDVNPHRDRYC